MADSFIGAKEFNAVATALQHLRVAGVCTVGKGSVATADDPDVATADIGGEMGFVVRKCSFTCCRPSDCLFS